LDRPVRRRKRQKNLRLIRIIRHLTVIALKNGSILSAYLVVPFISISQSHAQDAGSAPTGSTNVVVTGRRTPKTKDVIDQYSTRNIDNLAAMTIGEVITRLERRNGGRPFSIIVNGRRLADISDLREIPPEALAKIEILSNSSAGRYGFSPANKVLNLVLKKNFSSLTADAGTRLPTEGGGDSGNAALRYVNIKNERRFNAALSGQASEALYGRDRSNLLDDSADDAALLPYRTLLPSNRTISLTPGFALPLGAVNLNAFASLSDMLSQQLGRFFSTDATLDGTAQPVSAHGIIDLSHTRSFRLGLNASGMMKRINWTAELTGSLVTGQTSSRVSQKRVAVALAGGSQTMLPTVYTPLATSTNSSDLGGALTANAPLTSLPAGDMSMNTRLSVDLQDLASTTRSGQFSHQANAQMRSRAHFGLDVPLTSPEFTPFKMPGSTSLSLNGDYERAQHVGGMPSYDLSWEWQPIDSLSISLDRSATGSLTALSSSNAPVIYTPGALVVDAVTGDYALVTRISGGAPNLRSTSQSDMTARISFNKTVGATNMAATVEYESSKITNPIISVVTPNPQFQRLFPNRFIRDAAGHLTTMDTRPFNAAGETMTTLRPNIHLSGTIDTQSERQDSGVDWDLSLSHEWKLSDQLRPTQGTESVDLLKTPLDGVRGTPRHQVDVEAEASYRRLNVQLSAKWRSGSRVQDVTAAEPYSIHYASFWTADAVVSYTFKLQGKAAGTSKSLRVWLSVSNIFDRRQSVRDSAGHTPAAYEPAFLDPAGRIVAIRASIPL